MPGIRGQIHVDQPLTDLSLKYSNGALIADIVAPRVKVSKDSDLYYVYGRQDQYAQDDLRANGSPAKQIDSWAIDSTPGYKCLTHALKDKVTDEDRRNADMPINLNVDTVEALTNSLMLTREVRVASLYTTVANWGSGMYVTLSGTQQWNNASFDSDSKTDAIKVRINTAKEAIRAQIGMYPNTIIIPAAVAQVVADDPDIKERVKYTNSTLLVNGDLPPTLWNMRVLTPGSIKATSAKGQTFTGGDVWGKDVTLAYLAPNPRSPKVMTACMTFQSVDRTVRTWRDDEIEGDFYETKEVLVEKAVGTYCVYTIKAAIA